MKKLVGAPLVALLVAGCGGSGGGQTNSTLSLSTSGTPSIASSPGASGASVQSSPSASGTSIPSSPTASGVRPVITETVRSANGAGAWAATASAVPGESLEFRTVLGKKDPGSVRLLFAWGRGTGVTATATVDGHTSRTTVNSASGAHLTLIGLHYTCTPPPAPGFCAIHTANTTNTVMLTMRTSSPAPIVVAGTIGPKVIPGITTVAAHFAGAAVAPYKLVLTGRTVLPSATGGLPVTSPFESPVTVKPRDILVVAIHARGPLKGAAQRINVSLDRGPGTSLTASAAAAGQSAADLQIKSSNGSPVILAVPRYICFVPPAPTYCPPLQEGSSGGRYTFSFLAAPGRPPITLLATVAQG